jgi:hypothetical protein
MGEAPISFSRGCCEMGLLGITSHGLVPLSVFFGVAWHQFGRIGRHQFSFTQADTSPKRAAVRGMVGD